MTVSLEEIMRDREDDSKLIYEVVINHDEQYSIWPQGKELPAGWQFGGKSGSKNDCLVFIKGIWTDMRPLSLRRQMEIQAMDNPR
jgi:MbtH protein